MTPKEAFLLGLVEGITEFLPVSSTGHMILTAHLLGIKHDEFTKSFEIAVQLGAILAVLLLFWRRLIRDHSLWLRIGVAFLPTGIAGLSLYGFVKEHLIGNDLIVVVNLLLGGLVLIGVDRYMEGKASAKDVKDLPIWRVFLIGIFQSLALFPGVSRSGATIVGGILLGLPRKKAAEFSFLLAIPTMFSAVGYDLLKTGGGFSGDQWGLMGIGFLTAFLTAAITVKAFLNFLNSHGLAVFGLYRIAIALVYGFVFL